MLNVNLTILCPSDRASASRSKAVGGGVCHQPCAAIAVHISDDDYAWNLKYPLSSCALILTCFPDTPIRFCAYGARAGCLRRFCWFVGLEPVLETGGGWVLGALGRKERGSRPLGGENVARAPARVLDAGGWVLGCRRRRRIGIKVRTGIMCRVRFIGGGRDVGSSCM